ncbi:MAG: NRDE family protein [Planctomycetota bacterium]
MSLLAVVYHLVPEAPVLVACNRDESYSVTCPTPSIQSGKPRVLASIDPQSGGTNLGLNQNGLFAGMVRRKKPGVSPSSRSCSQLCREMLRCGSAREAIDLALEELHTGQYEGANLVVADSECGWVIHHGRETEVVELQPGLNIIGDRDVDDPNDARAELARRLLTLQTLDSPVKFLAVASKVFARSPLAEGRPSMVVRNRGFGTVSSTLISLGQKPRDAIYQYSNGSPDEAKFEDYSPLLRDILSRGLREARPKVKS